MANLTTRQAKARAEKIAEQLEVLRGGLLELVEDIENLKDEMQEEADNIEPYEGKEELTEQQEERQSTLQDWAECLEDVENFDIEGALDEIAEVLEHIIF